VSYNNSLDFGIIACRRSLPQIQRLIDHLEESLVELEEVAGIRSVKSRPRTALNATAKRKLKAKTKAKVKPKAKPKTKLKTKRKTTARSRPKNAAG